MTPTRLRECLGLLRWSQRGFAEALDCDNRMVRRWAAGDAPVPADVAEWLETVTGPLAATPIPTTWRRRPAVTELPRPFEDIQLW